MNFDEDIDPDNYLGADVRMNTIKSLKIYCSRGVIVVSTRNQKSNKSMAIEINRTPLVEGKDAERLFQQIDENETRAGSVDFSKEIALAKKILAKQS